MTTNKLTANQINLLIATCTDEYLDGEHPLTDGNGNSWAWSCLDWAPEVSRGGITSRAVAAGLIWHNQDTDRRNGKVIDASTLGITQAGWDAICAHIGTDPADLDGALAAIKGMTRKN